MNYKLYMEQYIMDYGFDAFERQMERLGEEWSPFGGRSLAGDAILLKCSVEDASGKDSRPKDEQIESLLAFLSLCADDRRKQEQICDAWWIFRRLYNELFAPQTAIRAVAEVYRLEPGLLWERVKERISRESTCIYPEE